MDENFADFMNDLRLRLYFFEIENVIGADCKGLPEITDEQMDAFIASRSS